MATNFFDLRLGCSYSKSTLRGRATSRTNGRSIQIKPLLLFVVLVCPACPDEIDAVFPCEEGVSRACECELETGTQLCNGSEWGVCLCLGSSDTTGDSSDADDLRSDVTGNTDESDATGEDQPLSDTRVDPDQPEDSASDQTDLAEGDAPTDSDQDEASIDPDVDLPDVELGDDSPIDARDGPVDGVPDTLVDRFEDSDRSADPDLADLDASAEEVWVSQLEGAVILGETAACGETVVIALDYPSERRVAEATLYFAHEERLGEQSPALQKFSRRSLEPSDGVSLGENTSEFAEEGVWRFFVGVLVVHEESGALIERVQFDRDSPFASSEILALNYTVECAASDVVPPDAPTLLETEADLGTRDCGVDGAGVAFSLSVSDFGSRSQSAAILWERNDGPFAPLYGTYAPFSDEDTSTFLLNAHIGEVHATGSYQIASMTLTDRAGNIRRAHREDLAANLQALHVQIDCDTYTMAAPPIESISMPREPRDSGGSLNYTISGQLGTGHGLIEEMIVEWEPIGSTKVGGSQQPSQSCAINGSGRFECTAYFYEEHSAAGPWGLRYIQFKFFGGTSDTLLYGDERLPGRTLEPAFFLY